MKPIAGLAIIIALAYTPLARAQDAPATTLPEYPPARLEAGYGIWYSKGSDSIVRQSRMTLAPEFFLGERLRLAALFRMTTTQVTLLQKNDMSFDATMQLPWQPSLGARASYELLRAWKLRLRVAGEFEFPLSENRAWLKSFTPRGEVEALNIDVEALRNHVTVDHRWRSVQGSLRLQGDFGWFHPYADVGYMVLDGRLAVKFDSKATSLLADANLSPDRYYNGGESTPLYMIGAEADLGQGMTLRLGGAALPSNDGKMFYAGETALSFPLGLLP